MELLPLLKNIKQKKVLVIGDLILDCYIKGNVRRISPEAPVPVVEVIEDDYKLGGAANVASNIVSMGGHATVIGVVGRDRASETMDELMRERGIEFFTVEDKRPTSVKTRVIAHSQQVVRIDQEDKSKVSGRALRGMLSNIDEAIRGHDAVIISDYCKGVITPDIVRAVLQAAKGKPVIVDPKAEHYRLYKGVTAITPNLNEAAIGSGIKITDDNRTLIRAGTRLLEKLGLEAVLLTRGPDGMSLFQRGRVTNIPTSARKVFDVTGAGDTVVGIFAMAYAAGATMQEAAVLANHAAGIVVAEVGTATATPEAVKQSIKGSKLNIEEVSI